MSQPLLLAGVDQTLESGPSITEPQTPDCALLSFRHPAGRVRRGSDPLLLLLLQG